MSRKHKGISSAGGGPAIVRPESKRVSGPVAVDLPWRGGRMSVGPCLRFIKCNSPRRQSYRRKTISSKTGTHEQSRGQGPRQTNYSTRTSSRLPWARAP